MSEDILSSLDGNFSDIPTGIPLLKPGLYELTVEKIDIVDNKAKDGKLMKLTYALTQPAEGTEGQSVSAGFKVFDQVSLKPTEKYNPKTRIAEFLEAVHGTKEMTFNPIEQHIGQTLSVRLSIEKDEQYGDKNRIQRYTKKAKA